MDFSLRETSLSPGGMGVKVYEASGVAIASSPIEKYFLFWHEGNSPFEVAPSCSIKVGAIQSDAGGSWQVLGGIHGEAQLMASGTFEDNATLPPIVVPQGWRLLVTPHNNNTRLMLLAIAVATTVEVV
jgi:hypothetical protein